MGNKAAQRALRAAMGVKRKEWGAWIDLTGAIDEDHRALLELTHGRTFIGAKQNAVFATYLYRWPDGSYQLVVFRVDKGAHITWGDKQRIKNELMGEGAEAVELYPSEARLIDTDNVWHLWLRPNLEPFPFGFSERGRVVTSDDVGPK